MRGVKSLLVVAVMLVGGGAMAQTCEVNVCPAGESYSFGGSDASGPFGVCSFCTWWGYCAHDLDHCPSGATLNTTTGVCEFDLCSGAACGGELPLCDANQVFAGPFFDANGKAYGTCTIGPVWPSGAYDHEVRYCNSGFQLMKDGGCFKPCLPDLQLGTVYLRDASGTPISAVHVGQKYQACALVVNAGSDWAGPTIVVMGGGLGIPSNPQASTSWLAPGTSRELCLAYPTTPAVGNYKLGLTVDPGNLISETSETNNSNTGLVQVIP